MAISKGKRHEVKFTLHHLDYVTYNQRMTQLLKEDHSENGSGYDITSIYFDDPYNTAYFEKIRGDEFRAKYRIRYYNNDMGVIKLEKKEKWQQMTVKSSTTLSVEWMNHILEGQYECLMESEDDLIKDFHYMVTRKKLIPKTVVRYHRNAYYHPVGDLRVTFDTDIRFAQYKKHIPLEKCMYVQGLGPNEVIMEIKFNGVLPYMVRDLIQASKTLNSSSSKYVYSRAFDYNY